MLLRLAPVAALAALATAPLFAQGADPLFSGSVVVMPTTQNAQAILDLDHDGAPDILSWVWTDAPSATVDPTIRAEGLLVDVEGHLVSAWAFDLPQPPYTNCEYSSTAVGDFDGDGYEDFAISAWSEIHVYRTRANDVPVLMETFTIPSGNTRVAKSLLAADIDGNGVDDIVTTNDYETMGYLSGGAAGSFSWVGRSSFTFGNIDAVEAVLDIDADGRDELVVRDVFPDNHKVYGFGGGAWGFQSFFVRTLEFAPAMTSGDIDGDGDEDLVVFDGNNYGEPRYAVHRQEADGTLTSEPWRQGGPATHLIDVDGDGDLDGLCCGGGGSSCDWDNTDPSTFMICLNDGAGNFDDAVPFDGLSTGAHGLAGVVDIDGDGDMDMVGGRTILINHTDIGATYCAPPANTTGAMGSVAFGGSASLSRADLVLSASDLPADSVALVLMAGRADSIPVGTSELCLAAPVRRLGVAVADAGGNLSFDLDPALFGSSYPGAVAPGATRRFQVWHRDVGVGAFGFTEAGRVTFAP